MVLGVCHYDSNTEFMLILLFIFPGKDWVIQQTLERARRELEADEREYEEQLATARKRENVLRKKAKAKVTKKPVWSFHLNLSTDIDWSIEKGHRNCKGYSPRK